MRKGITFVLIFSAVFALQGCGESESVATQSAALAPVQFATVSEMIDDRADFSAENGTFKLLAVEPVHIQLAARVVANDLPEVIASEVNRAAIYGVYRAFIHTNVDSVRVTVLPMEITMEPYSAHYLDAPKVDLVITRGQALQAIKRLVGVESFNDIVTPDESFGMQMDSWTKDFNPFYFEAAGQQALLNALTVRP